MTATALVKVDEGLPAPTSFDEIIRYAEMFASSGMFTDSKQMAVAATKILAGAELGIRPFAAMAGIHLMNGKAVLAANLIATIIKRSRRYNYRVTQHSATACLILFFEREDSRWVECGQSSFTIDDAKLSGAYARNPTWVQFPRNLLFARALSNGARWYCADIFGGPVYTGEELNLRTDDNGDVIDVMPISTSTSNSATADTSTSSTSSSASSSSQVAQSKAEDAEVVARRLAVFKEWKTRGHDAALLAKIVGYAVERCGQTFQLMTISTLDVVEAFLRDGVLSGGDVDPFQDEEDEVRD